MKVTIPQTNLVTFRVFPINLHFPDRFSFDEKLKIQWKIENPLQHIRPPYGSTLEKLFQVAFSTTKSADSRANSHMRNPNISRHDVNKCQGRWTCTIPHPIQLNFSSNHFSRGKSFLFCGQLYTLPLLCLCEIRHL